MDYEIIVAGAEQKHTFLDVWAEYLREHEKLGGDIRATQRTMAFFASLFDLYASAELLGAALLAVHDGTPIGASLWGQTGKSMVDRVDDEVVQGWGNYTAPEWRRQGVSKRMQDEMIVFLASLGAKEAAGVALLANLAGIENSRQLGFEPTVLSGTVDIQKEAERIGNGLALKEGFYWEGECPLCGNNNNERATR